MRIVDADALLKAFANSEHIKETESGLDVMEMLAIKEIIDNAPTVDTTCKHCDSGYAQGYSDGYLRGKEERPQGKSEKWKCCECFIRTKETGALLFCEAVGKCKFEKDDAE